MTRTYFWTSTLESGAFKPFLVDLDNYNLAEQSIWVTSCVRRIFEVSEAWRNQTFPWNRFLCRSLPLRGFVSPSCRVASYVESQSSFTISIYFRNQCGVALFDFIISYELRSPYRSYIEITFSVPTAQAVTHMHIIERLDTFASSHRIHFRTFKIFRNADDT